MLPEACASSSCDSLCGTFPDAKDEDKELMGLGSTFVMVQLLHSNDFGSLRPVCYLGSCPTFCLSACEKHSWGARVVHTLYTPVDTGDIVY
jgi:hypothetical protein